MTSPHSQLKIVIVGHVDHGKSTLVGRLFHDTDSLPDGKYEAIAAMCAKRGMPFEWSFLMDALQSERDQGITIDTSQIWFQTPKRRYVIIDAPGHKEFLKNMVSGAASSEAAVLVIDAKEGVREQSKRHGYLLHLLGVTQIAVAVNKMDAIGYSEAQFRAIETEYRAYLQGIGVEPTFVIPISAREGDCITHKSERMPWYTGPAVVEALDAFTATPSREEQPLRFPIQDVYKFDDRRIIAGRIESGRLRVGDEVLVSPRNRRVRVQSIEAWGVETLPTEAIAGQSIGIAFDEQIFAERGQMISHLASPPVLTNQFSAHLFWLADHPLAMGQKYRLKLATAEYAAEVAAIERVIRTDDLSHRAESQVEKGDVAEVRFRLKGQAALDAFAADPQTGRFVLVEGFMPVGGGIIRREGLTDQRVVGREVKSQNIFAVNQAVGAEQRALANGHRGAVLWFTGLSGAGKSTLAVELEHRLFAKGFHTYVLDGDNVRRGLCSDLGFSPEERSENIRRAGEVAALFADAGVVTITSFISPYHADREMARAAAPDRFHLVHIKADLATCEGRDVKGLYKKARAGEIPQFTGVSAPYEIPEDADLTIDTSRHSIEACVDLLVRYVEEQVRVQR